MNDKIRLRLGGDLMLGGKVLEKIKQFGPLYPFQHMPDEVNSPDVFFANLECTLSQKGTAPEGKTILLYTDPRVVEGMRKIGLNLLSLANNHSFDYGLGGFEETQSLLHKNGIMTVGGGRNREEAGQFALFEINGLRVAFLAYCCEVTGCRNVATEDSYGVACFQPSEAEKDVRRAKKESDIVIVSLHWGEQFMDYPDPRNVRIARSLVEVGAAVVVGSHAHVLQCYEVYRNGLIFYDLGSLIFGDIIIDEPYYAYFLREPRHREGMMVDCDIGKAGVDNVRFLPLYINPSFQAMVPAAPLSKKIVRRFLKQSRNLRRDDYELFYKRYVSRLQVTDSLRHVYKKALDPGAWGRLFHKARTKGTG